jgi:hypothetical protein
MRTIETGEFNQYALRMRCPRSGESAQQHRRSENRIATARRVVKLSRESPARRRADAGDQFDQALRAFAAPRFQALYRAWRERGNGVLEATQFHHTG